MSVHSEGWRCGGGESSNSGTQIATCAPTSKAPSDNQERKQELFTPLTCNPGTQSVFIYDQACSLRQPFPLLHYDRDYDPKSNRMSRFNGDGKVNWRSNRIRTRNATDTSPTTLSLDIGGPYINDVSKTYGIVDPPSLPNSRNLPSFGQKLAIPLPPVSADVVICTLPPK